MTALVTLLYFAAVGLGTCFGVTIALAFNIKSTTENRWFRIGLGVVLCIVCVVLMVAIHAAARQ